MSAYRNLHSGQPSGNGIGEGILRTMWRLSPAPGLPVFVRTGIDCGGSVFRPSPRSTEEAASEHTHILAAASRIGFPRSLSHATARRLPEKRQSGLRQPVDPIVT